MSVGRRIAIACVVFTALCVAIAAVAWQTQRVLSTLAINIYDHGFVVEDFLARGIIGWKEYAATQGAHKDALTRVLSDLEVASGGAGTEKTRQAIDDARARITKLQSGSAEAFQAARPLIDKALSRAARRLSDAGLNLRDEAEATARHARTVLLISMAAVLALAGLTGFLLSRSLVPPLRRSASTTLALANGDLEVEVVGTKRHDEIGELCRGLLVFKKALIEKAEMETDQQAQSEWRRQRQAALLTLTRAFDRAVAEHLSSVNDAVRQLKRTSVLLATRAEGINSGTGQVDELAANASTSARAVSGAASQLAAASRDIARAVQQSTDELRAMSSESNQAREYVEGLQDVARDMSGVVELISSVANQTGLLALNASIEASRAGEAGRGFAVVAQDVKTLAAQTEAATADISRRIAGMQEVAIQTAQLISGMVDRLAALETTAAGITRTVLRQGESTEAINRNLREAAQSISAVAAATIELRDNAMRNSAASKEVSVAALNVDRRSLELRGEVEQYTRAAQESSDWRGSARHKFVRPVKVTTPEGETFDADTVNLSQGGVALRTDKELRVRSACSVDGIVHMPLAASVVSCRDGTLHLAFAPAEEAKTQLETLIEELAQGHVAAAA
jgi:methyl-accepting chemotaxis protein